jgi:hypothetical protein
MKNAKDDPQMTLAWTLFLLGAIGALCFSVLAIRYRPHGGDLDQIAARVRTFNIESFRNLMDPGEQEYLREHLSFLEFRRVHFLRMTAGAEYLWAAARNARFIIQLAEEAKQNATPAVLETAERLQRNASLVCLHAFRVVPRLLLSALVPDITRHVEFIAEDYKGVVREMSMLRLLLYSGRTRTGMVAGGYAAAR